MPCLKMAATRGPMLLRNIMGHLLVRAVVRRPFWAQSTPSTFLLRPKQLPFRICSTEAGQAGSAEAAVHETESRFKEKPWEYLESEEYIEKYGNNPVWFGYRRNHKGQVPPQKTRKTCIRGKHVCENPCPICRDQNLFVDYRIFDPVLLPKEIFKNVKLLEQFICPHSGITYHPTQTGVCMQKYKQLTKAIQQAQDHGLLFFHIPFISFRGQDYSNQHPAVTTTPPSPALLNKAAWYDWYDWQQPPEKKIALMRRIYKNYLREESGPP